MKKIIRWKCEICGTTYEKKARALECEEKGPPEFYPIGCMYGNHGTDTFYTDITFAVASNVRDGGDDLGHFNVGGSWACRDNGAGDTLGKERCGTTFLKLSTWNAKLDPEHPTFKRMVAFLQSQDIPVTVWDGEKAITLMEFLDDDANVAE